MFFRTETKPSFLLLRRLGSVTTPILRPLNFRTARGRDLRTVVSRETGLPVGIFRLTNDSGQEIFDCQILERYGLQLGCTVYLETWDGWNELIPAAISGFAKQVSFSSDKIRPLICILSVSAPHAVSDTIPPMQKT